MEKGHITRAIWFRTEWYSFALGMFCEPIYYPIRVEAAWFNPIATININARILKRITYAAYSLTPINPDIKTIISNTHHSRHIIKAEGIPSSIYSFSRFVLSIFGS